MVSQAMFWLSRGLLLTRGHGLPAHRSGSQGVYSSHWDMVSQAIVLALKGLTPHTGSTGFAGPRTTRCILATALVLKLPIAGVPLQDLSFSVSIPRSIVQTFALISVNSVALISEIHPCQMTLSIGTWFVQRPSGMQVPPDVLHLGLSLVLSSLRLSPHELIREISLQYLTLRPVFLVALTPGRKPTQLHALSSLSSMWHMSQRDLFTADVAHEPDGSIYRRCGI